MKRVEKMKKLTTLLAALAIVLGISGVANAALINNFDGTISDDDTGLMWLQDANVIGLATWTEANTWAEGLVFGGYDDWRLPTTLENDPGCDNTDSVGQTYGRGCTGSEMGHMYYYEPDIDILGQPRDRSPFTNFEFDRYWSSTPYPGVLLYWYFDHFNGFQYADSDDPSTRYYAWAVRDIPAQVPEPSTLLLLGAGLIGLGFFRRKEEV